MPDVDEVYSFFNNTIDRDLLYLMTGEVLGSGIGRVVFECAVRDDLVVKIETVSKSFQNVLEWETWRNVRKIKDVACWFAPCVQISQCGTILLQRRTTPVKVSQLPKRLPEFLTDHKAGNYGDLDGRLVCHDYGHVVVDFSMKHRKVDWWE